MAAHAAPGWLGAIRAAAPASVGLIRSYEVTPGAADFDLTHANTAYVYDNAVAGLALLAGGERAAAQRIGEALAVAQAHDRFYSDGRLRNAYAAGPMTMPASLSGWWQGRWVEDPYQAGTATGVLAWAMLLWHALGGFAAEEGRAADFIERSLRAPRGYYGGFLGFEPTPARLDWVSTEQCLDLAVVFAFAGLRRAGAAAHARDLVAAMWSPADSRFFSGLRPDGSTNPHSAVDANLWPLLATGRAAWRPALDWVLAQHGLPRDGPVDGVDFDTDRDGIWLEGTAITALAMRRSGRDPARLLATIAANTAPSGFVYASTTPALTTGLTTGADASAPPFLYFRRPHLAATAWAALAAMDANPFDPLLTSPK